MEYVECTNALDQALTAAGWTESGGIALWENPSHPTFLIDTNADAPSIYNGGHDPINLGMTYDAEVALFASLGIVVPNYDNRW